MRLIDADALKAKYEQMLPEIGDGYHKETLQDVLFELEYAPTISPDEVRGLGMWISAEERLPEDFQKVLVFWWEHSEPMVDTAFWQKDAKRFDGEHWVRMEDKVTHWMPLPEPPKEVE